MKKSTFIKSATFIVTLISFLMPAKAQTILNPTNDTYIQGGDNSTTNFGSSEEIRIKGSETETYCRKGLLQFDLSSIISVNNATLRLYANSANSYDITAYETTDDWDESTVTWDSAPAIGDAIVSTAISDEGIYYEWDITTFVQNQFSGDSTVSIYLADSTLAKKNVDFNSNEAGVYMPELVITEKETNYTSLTATADAYIYYWGTKKHVANYGTETSLAVKYNNSCEKCIDSYIQFDISSFSDPLEDVYLKLYADSLERSTRISIYALEENETWTETEISGYNKPRAGKRIGIYSISSPGENTFDISEYFNEAITSGLDTMTLVIKEYEGAYVSFKSTETDDNVPEIIYGDEITTYTATTSLSGTFYIDSENGDDSNDGTSEETPWQNISKLSELTFDAGTTILLKRGSVWSKQTLSFNGSGTADKPISITAYGSGDKPSLQGDGAVYEVIQLFNQEYIEISYLDIQNEGASMDNLRRGIYALADNYGALNHLEFTNIDFTNINGSDGTGSSVYGNSDDEKRSGGILMEVRGDDVQTYFDDVLIDQCYFYNVSNTGISNSSHWTTLTYDSDWDDNIVPGTSNSDYVHNFVPSKNILIKRNRFEQIMSQGLIIRTAEDPVMEYNLFYYCSVGDGSDNACFNSKTTGAIWRYNESCYTQWNDDQSDGAGIDSDLRTKNTLIEYNYCHHNEYGGIITTGGSTSSSYNDSTIIRYNILANNGNNGIRICNQNSNALIFNNLIYYDDADTNKLIFQHVSDSTPSGPLNTNVSNNIFYTTNSNGIFSSDVDWDDTRVERCNYSNNLYYGIADDDYPDDANIVTADPTFIDGTVPSDDIGGYLLLGDDGIPTGEVDPGYLSGFELNLASPAIDAGIDDEAYNLIPSVDFKNEAIPMGTSIDIGPFEFNPDTTTSLSDYYIKDKTLKIYPNPAYNNLYINLNEATESDAQYQIINGNGKICCSGILNNRSINVSMLSSGIYTIKIATDNASYESIFIKM
jgi:hypothetical protein